MVVTEGIERDALFWKFIIIYRVLLNKKLYIDCFATEIGPGICGCD